MVIDKKTKLESAIRVWYASTFIATTIYVLVLIINLIITFIEGTLSVFALTEVINNHVTLSTCGVITMCVGCAILLINIISLILFFTKVIYRKNQPKK
jgi:hypothetical protein